MFSHNLMYQRRFRGIPLFSFPAALGRPYFFALLHSARNRTTPTTISLMNMQRSCWLMRTVIIQVPVYAPSLRQPPGRFILLSTAATSGHPPQPTSPRRTPRRGAAQRETPSPKTTRRARPRFPRAGRAKQGNAICNPKGPRLRPLPSLSHLCPFDKRSLGNSEALFCPFLRGKRQLNF